jgi:copper chaperone CopZ
MKKLKLLAITTIILTANAGAALANCTTPNEASIKVNGLVCDFCARTLEKVFSKHDEVNSIKVDLSAGTIDIKFNDGKTIDDASITKLITDSGYNVTAINKTCNKQG